VNDDVFHISHFYRVKQFLSQSHQDCFSVQMFNVCMDTRTAIVDLYFRIICVTEMRRRGVTFRGTSENGTTQTVLGMHVLSHTIAFYSSIFEQND
jgi:hypothetical protein